MKNKRGFTLVELLAVIIILSVIMLVTVPQVYSTIRRGKVRSHNAMILNIQQAAYDYVMEFRYDTTKITWTNSDTATIMIDDLVDTGFLRAPIIDPLIEGDDNTVPLNSIINITKVNNNFNCVLAGYSIVAED